MKEMEVLRLILIGHFMRKEDLNFDKSVEVIEMVDEIMPIIEKYIVNNHLKEVEEQINKAAIK